MASSKTSGIYSFVIFYFFSCEVIFMLGLRYVIIYYYQMVFMLGLTLMA
jgi:hypothetical protein